ncbi:HrgA protein [Clostridium botulinum]|nr:HrgA protein [Clostridium botulinum]
MGYSFVDLAKDTFKSVMKPLSINDIWRSAVELGYADKVSTSGKTPWQTLGARIYTDIKQNADTEFIQISKRPAIFYLKNLYNDNRYTSEDDEKKANDEVAEKVNYNERDLHILLSTFVYSNPHFNCYTKTIFHENSKKNQKGYNKWLHPDLVGIYFPFDKFQNNILKLLDTLKENAYKLFSFEVKIELNFSNLRQSYFQAVSNSSWAHEGYLVALKIEDEPLLIDEIRRLNNAFGIGVIRLDRKNIEQSEILFSAKDTGFLDWETIDRLSEENCDFKGFIEDLMEDIKLGKVKSKYDKILDVDEYEQYVKSKGIF